MIQKVILGDCLEKLKEIGYNFCDAIIIDPPYEIEYNNEKWDNKILFWPYLFEQYKRILKDTGNLIIFQGWSNVCETIGIGKKYFELKNWIAWDRIKCRGATKNLASGREDILWFIKSDNYTFNKIYSNTPKKTGGMGTKNNQKNRCLTNVFYDISPIPPWSPERVKHPTQKPLQLMERLVTIFSNKNDLVLDCFSGSGTTGVAAKKLNRQFILIEKEEEYYDIILKRLGMENPDNNPDILSG